MDNQQKQESVKNHFEQMKALVIGTSLSGKTTIIRHLRPKSTVPILEMDEELKILNKGEYPEDIEYKLKVLTPKIIDKILNRKNIIFFTNTDYFTIDDLLTAKKKGFKIIQLELDLDQLKKRNEYRVKKEGYEDLGKWFKGMLQYQEVLRNKGIVDKIIHADQPVENIVKEIQKVLH